MEKQEVLYLDKRGQNWRQRLCSTRDKVCSTCQMTCGLCYKNDPGYKYTTKKRFSRDCEWTARSRRRIKKYCKRKGVRSYCPIICRNCQVKHACINNSSFRLDAVNGKNLVYGLGRKRFIDWSGVSSQMCAEIVLQHADYVARIIAISCLRQSWKHWKNVHGLQKNLASTNIALIFT